MGPQAEGIRTLPQGTTGDPTPGSPLGMTQIAKSMAGGGAEAAGLLVSIPGSYASKPL
jgi:hypothetical protein